ncbi:hypothetical protein ACFQ9Q_34590 [Streptomyces virginiae]|uniref:hypothetical protein n=1 Tax=Streptomyces virginiae TaxID=1961 RepID=UPI0036A804AE
MEIYHKRGRVTQPLCEVLSLQADVLDGLGRIQDAQTVRDLANPNKPDSHN